MLVERGRPMKARIPGLQEITEETDADGTTRIVFHIDDDRVDDFFGAFGLQPNDHDGFQRAVTEALNRSLSRIGGIDEQAAG